MANSLLLVAAPEPLRKTAAHDILNLRRGFRSESGVVVRERFTFRVGPLPSFFQAGVDPYRDVLTLERYRELFGENKNPFTGVDYVQYYSDLIQEAGAEVEVLFANDPKAILAHTRNVLNCDVQTRARTKRILRANGAQRVCGLAQRLQTVHTPV